MITRMVMVMSVLLAVGLSFAQDKKEKQESADNAPPEGFTALFNGSDLSGWKGLLSPVKHLDNPAIRAKLAPEEQARAQLQADANMHAHWKVVDGVITFDGKGDSLCTIKDYGNFEMYVDWKITPAGDSGIYLRGSPQVQIWDPANKAADGTGSGGLYNNQKNPSKPSIVADKPIGQWNTFHIKMIGDKVTVWLNEQLVVDNVTLENYWIRSMPIFATGQIELQNHSSPLWFKNVYIKELR